mgnify:CR=1 FL=1
MVGALLISELRMEVKWVMISGRLKRELKISRLRSVEFSMMSKSEFWSISVMKSQKFTSFESRAWYWIAFEFSHVVSSFFSISCELFATAATRAGAAASSTSVASPTLAGAGDAVARGRARAAAAAITPDATPVLLVAPGGNNAAN